ncbi:hypothetical protein Y032_0163g3475 [Ancylostoma ceylanicum]|uniref:Phlebovirus glycoprotein G2 fusion domain-containing protein n=1 Tax=Ancylostoma ceylanicum TaxID=53326 RepID=A0A016SXC2_9BILA|nr:hypothetical protein Y032_0163g3475 [Ancylostoma ceylanicum]
MEIQCMKGEVVARNLISFSDIQVSAINHCIETQSEIIVMLPAHICLHQHEVRIEMKHDYRTDVSVVFCTLSTFCGMINCYICYILTNSPHCVPRAVNVLHLLHTY